ncbi:MAG: TetR/AcrR family transcriptional regulator [Proteobacteria bacterium]|nr:TetR/AcrR family transcriptional regulator [Pseudomonadota bacterium]
MQNPPKQSRSKLRIQTIIETAEKILLEEGIDNITIAHISELSGLKRTSTYKFFPTPKSLKSEMSNIYISECIRDFKSKSENIKTDNLSVIVLRCVGILYDYFDNNLKAQKLILSNEFSPSLETDKIKLPEMFNKDGVYRVFTQIIISIFSLNLKENDSIDEVGKIEAHRAGHAYLLDWVNQSS